MGKAFVPGLSGGAVHFSVTTSSGSRYITIPLDPGGTYILCGSSQAGSNSPTSFCYSFVEGTLERIYSSGFQVETVNGGVKVTNTSGYDYTIMVYIVKIG